jgi:hypothetical protein
VVVHGQEVQEALNIAAFATVLGMVSMSSGWQLFASIMQLAVHECTHMHCVRAVLW